MLLVVADVFLRVLVYMGAVRGGVGQVQVEGLVPLAAFVDKGQGVVGDDVRQIAPGPDALGATVGLRVVIGAAAAQGHEPVRIALLGMTGGAQVPFAADAADVAVLDHPLGVAGDALQIFHRGIPMDLAGTAADPVVDPVLGGNAARQQGGPCRGADRRGAEEIFHPHAVFGQTVDVRGANFLVAVAAQGPIALVVGENQNHVGAFFAVHGRTSCYFFISIPDFCVHGL